MRLLVIGLFETLFFTALGWLCFGKNIFVHGTQDSMNSYLYSREKRKNHSALESGVKRVERVERVGAMRQGLGLAWPDLIRILMHYPDTARYQSQRARISSWKKSQDIAAKDKKGPKGMRVCPPFFWLNIAAMPTTEPVSELKKIM